MKFDISKFSQREKNLIGIMLISVATIPLFIQTMPAWQEFNESKSKIQQDSIKLKNLQAQIKKLEQLGKENQELARKVDAQKLYLAKSYEVDFLVQDLKSICDESSVSLESFTPSSPEPINIVLENQISTELAGTSRSSRKTKSVKDKLKGEDLPVDLYRLPIEVRVKGDFTEILDLFKKLEKYGRVISVENISIGKVQASKSFGGGNRLSKSSNSSKSEDTSSLLGSFDLVAYSLAGEGETLPFASLERTVKSIFKSKK